MAQDYGLLSDPWLNMGVGLLARSINQPRPVNIGQALQGGLGQYGKAIEMQQAMREEEAKTEARKQAAAMQQMQIQQMQQAMAEKAKAQKWFDEMPSFVSTPGQQAMGAGAAVGDVGPTVTNQARMAGLTPQLDQMAMLDYFRRSPEKGDRLAALKGFQEMQEAQKPKIQVFGDEVLQISPKGGVTSLYKGGPKADWSEPFELGGATVQRNTKTNEVKTAVTRPPQIKVEGTANNMDDATLDFVARQALTGDKSVLVGLARTKGALAKVRGRMAAIANEQGIAPEQLAIMNAEYFGQTAGQRSIGTRTAAIELAANEANKMADITLGLFPKVNPSQFPSLNALKNAVDKQLGGPDVVALNTSLNSLVNIYARAINPSGVATVSDKEHARQLIDSAMGSGQLPAAIAVMKQEMDAALASPGEVKQGMRNRFLGKEKPTATTAPKSLVDQIPGGGGAVRKYNPATGRIE